MRPGTVPHASEKPILGVLHPGPNNPSQGPVNFVNLAGQSDLMIEYGIPRLFHPRYVRALQACRPLRIYPDGTKSGFEVLPQPGPKRSASPTPPATPAPTKSAKSARKTSRRK